MTGDHYVGKRSATVDKGKETSKFITTQLWTQNLPDLLQMLMT